MSHNDNKIFTVMINNKKQAVKLSKNNLNVKTLSEKG